MTCSFWSTPKMHVTSGDRFFLVKPNTKHECKFTFENH